jgi:hypothetical protein
MTLESAASHLSSSLASRASEPLSLGNLGSEVERDYGAQASRRLRSWDWTWASTPPFSISLRSRAGIVALAIKAGLVASASGPGEELLLPYIGQRFDYGLPDACLRALEEGRIH